MINTMFFSSSTTLCIKVSEGSEEKGFGDGVEKPGDTSADTGQLKLTTNMDFVSKNNTPKKLDEDEFEVLSQRFAELKKR